MIKNNIYTVNPVMARALSNRSTQVSATTPVSNMSVTEKAVLSSVQANLTPNQYAYSNVNANGTILSANTETDVLYITTESPISTEVANDVLLFKIVEDPNHLFVTQAKITEWDNKAGKSHTHKGEDIVSGLIAPEVIAILPISHIEGLTVKLSEINTAIENRYTKPEIDLKVLALQASINQLASDMLTQSNSYSKAYIDETFATKASVTLVSNALSNHIATGMHITQAERTLLSYFSIVDGKIKVSVDFYSLGEISAYGVGSGSGGSGGAVELNDLTDVTITSPVANHILKYNGTAWVNSILDLSTYATTTYVNTAINTREPSLGNPSTTGYVLSSTNAGTRSWVALPTQYTHPTYTTNVTSSSGTPGAGGAFDVINAVSINSTGHFIGYNVRTITMPSGYTHPTSPITPGIYKSVTVDSLGHVSAGTNPTTLGGYGITDAMKASTVTYTLPATIGWYRIASSIASIGRSTGRFDISWTVTGSHGECSILAGTQYGWNPYISQQSYSAYDTTINKVRLVYHGTYSGNYSFVEIYNSTAKALTITITTTNNIDFNVITTATAGSIPSGYSSKELTLTNGYATSGNIYALGEVTAYSASDVRLKENINSIVSALHTIDRLNPVTYNWNSTAKELNNMKTDGLEYGLIAQELEEVLPELVHPLYSNYKAIDYIKLIPLLIKGIQELNKKIKDHGID